MNRALPACAEAVVSVMVLLLAPAVAREWLAPAGSTAGAQSAVGSDGPAGPDLDAVPHRPPPPRSVRTPVPRQVWGNVPYNARFTFSRIRYGGPGWGRRGGGSWSHDYPRADQHMPQILEFMTFMSVNTGASNVFTLDDPEIFQHPMIYISEPGFWTITDSEARNLREYLLKGGFVMLDDFEGNQFYNMAAQLRRAMPEYEPIEIGPEHDIFDSFFLVENIYIPHPLVPVIPVYFGIFEDNDPSKRMLAIINHNNDLAEYWEWSDSGWFPVDLTNEAYKLGVNYVIHAMTH